MACPVVAIHPGRNEVVIHGGAVHLSKDYIEEDGKKCFGKVVSLNHRGWETQIRGTVTALSQEHGIVRLSDEDIADVKIGELIGIIPIHSCLTADLQGHYLATTGEWIEKMPKE